MYIEQFVVENLNEHRKGILGRTMPVSHMLSWTKVRRSDKTIVERTHTVHTLIFETYVRKVGRSTKPSTLRGTVK